MLQRWRRAGIRVHLLVPALLALGVIVMAFIAIAAQALHASTQSAMQERLVLAKLMAHQVDAQLDHALDMLNAATNDKDLNLEDGNMESEKRLLDSIHEHSSLFTRVLLLDIHGTVLGVEPYDDRMMGVNLLIPPYNVPPPQPGGPSFWRAASVSTQKPGVVARFPIESSGGGTVGYLFGWIDMSDPLAASLLYPYKPGSDGYADLVDDQGIVLASTQPERLGQLTDHAHHLGTLIQEKQPTVGGCHSCHDPDGGGRQDDALAFAPLSGVPWGIVLRQPEYEILAPTRFLAYQLVALGVVVLAAFLGLVWFTTRGVVDPLQLLAQACRRIAGGDFSLRVPSMGVAETSVLATSFEEMRRRLLQSRDDMERHHRELERRVEERTAELALSHRQLEQSRDYLLKTNRNLTALNSVAAIVSRSLNLEDILGSALDKVLDAMAVETGGVYLRDEQTGDLLLTAHRGIPEASISPLSRLTFRDLFREVVPSTDSRSWSEACRRELEERMAPGSLLSAPLAANDEILGCLFVASERAGLLAQQEEETLLVSIGWQMAVAVRNVHSYSILRQEQKARGELLHRVLGAQEEERKRIARELHDETCQTITALMLTLDTVRLAMSANPQEAAGMLDTTKEMAAGILEDIRRLVADLRPSLLDDLGLVPAIVWCGERRLKPQGIELRLQTDGFQERLPPRVETALFRIVQEALSNAVKHAKASVVTVTLDRLDGHVTLAVEDDGIGFELPRTGVVGVDLDGFGLRGMQERASDLGGGLILESAPGEGTRITVEIPIQGDVL